MKKIIVIIALALFLSCGGDTVAEGNNTVAGTGAEDNVLNIRENGIYYNYTDFGKIQSKAIYQNGQLHGLLTNYNSGNSIDYSANNSITQLLCFSTGVLERRKDIEPCLNRRNTGTGTDTIKDLRDSIYITYGYQNGQLHGLYTRYHNPYINSYNNSIHFFHYKDGKKHGLFTFYYEAGQIKSKGNFKEGKQDGLTWYYHDDNSIRALECYQNDTLHTEATEEEEREEENNPNSFSCP